MDKIAKETADLKALIDLLLNDPDGLEPYFKELAQNEVRRQRERTRRNNASFAQLLSQTSDKQALLISQHESRGYKVNKVYFNRSDKSGNVGVMLVNRQIWNDVKGRMGTKIVMIYADGGISATFEKSISIRKEL